MNTLVIFLSALSAASALTYKGTQSLKVGKKTYKCAFNIAYTTAACKKKTVKCKPTPPKPIKFAIKTKDATISVTTAKNKISACKVAPLAPAPVDPTEAPVIPPSPGSTEELDCTCTMPLMNQPPPIAVGRSLQAKVLENVLNRQGLLGNLLAGNNGGAPAANGLLGNLLGGGNGGAPAANGLAGLLSGGGGGGAAGGLQNAIMQAALQNMINQAIDNPESLQEMINLAVNSGMAEQTVNSLIESGQIENLVQDIIQSGKGEEMLGNVGDGIMNQEAVQSLLSNNDLGNLPNVDDLSAMLNGMDPGKLDSVLEGVDLQNMGWQMKCSCKKAVAAPVVG